MTHTRDSIELTQEEAERAVREFISRQNRDVHVEELIPAINVPPATQLRVPKHWRVQRVKI
jgi:hypothetical protein